jgi:hypothetical protein
VQLGGEVDHVPDIGVMEHVYQREETLGRRDLYDGRDIDVVMAHDLPTPVSVGMDLRVCCWQRGRHWRRQTR